MKCPHCEKEISGSLCPKCGETNFEDATYCMACGTSLKESAAATYQGQSSVEDDEDIDFDNRVLCPDGTCTGIIVDGRCSECGKVPGDGDAPEVDVEKAVTEEQTGGPETDEPETDEPVKEKDS